MVEVEALLNNNKIFRDRMDGIGAMTKEDAIATGCVGPIARACGVDYDVRKDYPYSVYPELEFDVPRRHDRRLLRPLPRAHRGDQAVASGSCASASKQIPDGPVDGRRPALHAAAEGRRPTTRSSR